MNNRYFTKSAYKIGCSCKTKLYYCCDNRYSNYDDADEFKKSLANGGFQVGELARIYYDIPKDNIVDSKDYDESLKKTHELFGNEDINIAEAAFSYNKYFVRADIIEKNGNQINLIEVKAKSYDPDEIQIKGKSPITHYREYIYDVAFQKYVVTKALESSYPNEKFTVKAFLLMADKTKVASVDGMNQFFRINNDSNKDRVTVMTGAEELAKFEHILTAFDVDSYCNDIICSPDYEKDLDKMCHAYCNHLKMESDLTTNCFKCQFHSSDGKLDGFKECWKEKAGFTDADFERPYLRNFSMAGGFWRRANDLISKGLYFMSDFASEDLVIRNDSTSSTRRLIQYALETGDSNAVEQFRPKIVDDKYFLDKDGLKKEMDTFSYPLHFIDFETAASALPFYKGMRPYEDIAFQYSHHIVRKNEDGSYRIEHAGQFLNVEKGVFPNFLFVRNLRTELMQDNGTIFRYSNHENKILRSIREQLLKSDETDKEELISFIDSITHNKKTESETHKGERDMVDLEMLVKKYFHYPQIMNGRTSIKVVLPAVLNLSGFLYEKYSKPIYGKEIHSCNYSSKGLTVAWVKKDSDTGVIVNPYSELDNIEKQVILQKGISEEEYVVLKEKTGGAISNGGMALMAYSNLQYLDDIQKDIIAESLLRYCELDTMAMVFIWEFFNSQLHQ